jgi:hypothetical protein
MRLRGLLVLAAAAAIVLVPAATPASLPQLIGSVGPGFSITMLSVGLLRFFSDKSPKTVKGSVKVT